MKKNILNIGLLALVGFAGIVASCSNDFDFDEARRENPEFAYKENFEKAFGKIDPNQSWDFTTGAEVRGTRVVNDQYGHKDNNYVQIKTDVLNWLKTNLGEGNNNSSKGKAFAMTVPKGGFRIIPIYQGYAYRDFEIHMVIENAYPNNSGDAKDYDAVIWCRNDIVNSNNSSSPSDFKYTTSATVNNATNATNVNRKSLATSGQESVGNVASVFSKPIIFAGADLVSSPFPTEWVGKTMYFYLYRINNNTGHNRIDSGEAKTTRSSINTNNKNFVYLQTNIATPDFIGTASDGTKNEYRIVGCEMNINSDGSNDHDMNDAVFIIEGFPKVPQEIDISPNGYTKYVEIPKRYMVEDLGATDESDIDFNDVVIDLTYRYDEVHTWTEKNGVKDPTKPETIEYKNKKYSATVRALGGTKNLSVFLKEGTTPNPASDPCIFTKDLYGMVNPVTAPQYNSSSNSTNMGLTASIMYNTIASSQASRFSGKYLMEYNPANKDSYIATIDLHGIDDAKQWDPAKNNIYVVVYDDMSGALDPFTVTNGSRVVEFPGLGEVPAMIAVDPSQMWNWERKNVFKSEEGCLLQLVNGTGKDELNNYPIKP